MHPSRFENLLNIAGQILQAGSEAIKPAEPGIATDVQLGLVLFGLVNALFHHMAANPPAAPAVTAPPSH